MAEPFWPFETGHLETGHFSTAYFGRQLRRWRLWLRCAVEAPTLGQLLLRRGAITAQQLAHGIAIQRLSGERLGHVLVRLEYLAEAELDHILSRQRLLRWLSHLVG